MIQTIGKILVILLVTALIAGGLYALVQGTGANAAAGGAQFERQNPSGSAGRLEGFREHDGGGEASMSRGMGGLLVTLLQIGAITFVVLQIQKALTKPTGRNLPHPV